MSGPNYTKVEAPLLESIRHHLQTELSDIEGLNTAIFGSVVNTNEAAPPHDVDLWLEGSIEAEEAAAVRIMTNSSKLETPYHPLKSADYTDRPELRAALRFEVASTGLAVIGQLPSVPAGYSAEMANLAFSEAALSQSAEMADRAEIIAQAGLWSDGSFAVEAIRSWFFSKAAESREWRAIKTLTRAELMDRLSVYDKELAESVADKGWMSAEIATRIRKLVLANPDLNTDNAEIT